LIQSKQNPIYPIFSNNFSDIAVAISIQTDQEWWSASPMFTVPPAEFFHVAGNKMASAVVWNVAAKHSGQLFPLVNYQTKIILIPTLLLFSPPSLECEGLYLKFLIKKVIVVWILKIMMF
jgi:hypothetical protein